MGLWGVLRVCLHGKVDTMTLKKRPKRADLGEIEAELARDARRGERRVSSGDRVAGRDRGAGEAGDGTDGMTAELESGAG